MSKAKKNSAGKKKDEEYPLPIYPESEDIFEKEKEESLDDDEAPARKTKAKGNIKGEDLDIPGTELDDEDEAIGEEDEENNYYSLGGDDHDDLEDDQTTE